MLVSIRANSNLPVTLVSDNYPQKDWHILPDKLVKPEFEDYHINGKFSVAKAKLSLWKYSDYEETIYLDVDGLLFRELDFEFSYFDTHVNGYSSLEHDNLDVNLWVFPEVVYEKYKIPKENKLPGTNSSFMAWDERGTEILKQALENLENPIPVDQLRYAWGKSNLDPDELYLNVALAQKGFKPEPVNILFTRKRNARGGYVGFEYIRENFHVICCWGGLEFNAFEISGTGSINSGLYNKLMQEYFKKVYGENIFYDHFFSLINRKIYERGVK